MPAVRVLTWNVRSLRDDARGVAAFLRELNPDVALLQEAPRLLPLWPLSICLLARRSGLRQVTGAGLACGNLLLVSPRVQVLADRSVRLPRRPGLHRRGAVLATVDTPAGRMRLLGTHLDLEPAARLDSARRLRALAGDPGALVVGADVNETGDGPAWAALAQGLGDLGERAGPTFPQRAPSRRIDALLAGPGWQAVQVSRPQCGPVSDHLPVVADLVRSACGPAGQDEA